MTPDLRILFTRRALTGVESLAPNDRADLYDTAAEILSLDSATIGHADAATKAAREIRQAEAAQLHFRALLDDPQS